MHISSSYAKILGETNFQPRKFPRCGSKAKDGDKERKEERLNDGDNNGQATQGACKHASRLGQSLWFWGGVMWGCKPNLETTHLDQYYYPEEHPDRRGNWWMLFFIKVVGRFTD